MIISTNFVFQNFCFSSAKIYIKIGPLLQKSPVKTYDKESIQNCHEKSYKQRQFYD